MEIVEAQEPETNAVKAERADWTEEEWLKFFEQCAKGGGWGAVKDVLNNLMQQTKPKWGPP